MCCNAGVAVNQRLLVAALDLDDLILLIEEAGQRCRDESKEQEGAREEVIERFHFDQPPRPCVLFLAVWLYQLRREGRPLDGGIASLGIIR